MAELVDILAPTDEEGTRSIIGQWLKHVGDLVKQHEPLLEITTDKATVEIAAPESGVLAEILKDANQEVAPGDLLGRIDLATSTARASRSAPPSTAASASAAATSSAATAVSAGADDALSPAVRRMLQEHGISASQVQGTGRGGRITAQDVEAYVAARASGVSAATGADLKARETRSTTPTAAPTVTTGPIPSHRVPHTPMRRMIADHMVLSMLKTAPHVTTIFEADLGRVIADRAARKDALARDGVRLGLSAYFVDAAVKALLAVPEVNSRYHDDALEIFDDVNIGFATSLEKSGLVVPVIHRAQTLDLRGLALRIDELTRKAQAGKLERSELSNGTFTVNNHGTSGSLIATPIINQPQSAILGIGKLQKRAVVIESPGGDAIAVRPMCYVSLTVDHRAMDGFTANVFLTKFVELLERGV